MEPIDNVSRTMDALRREMARNLERLRKEGAVPLRQAPSFSKPALPLRQTVARAIKALDPAEPRFSENAVTAFVESVLLNQFGAELVNDAEFHNLARRVSEAMLADAFLAKQLAGLIRQLSRE